MSKDEALQSFLQASPFAAEHLYFDFLREHDGAISIFPVPGDRAEKVYIDGTAVRHYDFALQILLQVSDTTDAVNTDNVLKLRVWQDWIEEQEKAQRYPDFGDGCSQYRWLLLGNMPVRAIAYDNGMAKYQFFARLQYREAS